VALRGSQECERTALWMRLFADVRVCASTGELCSCARCIERVESGRGMGACLNMCSVQVGCMKSCVVYVAATFIYTKRGTNMFNDKVRVKEGFIARMSYFGENISANWHMHRRWVTEMCSVPLMSKRCFIVQ